LLSVLVVFPFMLSRLFFNIKTKIVDWITCSDVDNCTDVMYDLHKSELALDLFFNTCARFISLFCYTLAFVFLFYGWNSNFFDFPDKIKMESTDYNLSNAVVFITYLPISLPFEVFAVIFSRKYYTRQTKGEDLFQVGVNYLKDNAIFLTLFLVTLHIGQDVFIARNRLNFCFIPG